LTKRSKILVTGAAALAIVAGGTGAAIAAGGGEDASEGPDVPITGSALEQAKTAALDYIGQGTVSGTETGDEESFYEVEVTLDNGSQTDVQLDRDFNVVGSEHDSESDG